MFVPRREHARFCSVACRVAWNLETHGDPAAEASALHWSITAMSNAIERLRRARAGDSMQALTMIGETVWLVTIVDATLVRYHPDVYDGVLAAQTGAERELIEGTLAGLRFVRNRTGGEADLAEFVGSIASGPGAGTGRITGWAWRSVPEPAVASQPPRGQQWELARYRAYQEQLAGHTLGDTFGRAVAFLRQTAAEAPSITDSANAAR